AGCHQIDQCAGRLAQKPPAPPLPPAPDHASPTLPRAPPSAHIFTPPRATRKYPHPANAGLPLPRSSLLLLTTTTSDAFYTITIHTPPKNNGPQSPTPPSLRGPPSSLRGPPCNVLTASPNTT